MICYIKPIFFEETDNLLVRDINLLRYLVYSFWFTQSILFLGQVSARDANFTKWKTSLFIPLLQNPYPFGHWYHHLPQQLLQ